MRLRNLIINDNPDLENRDKLLFELAELEKVIENNFKTQIEYHTIEFNLGRSINGTQTSLIIYNNPARNKNPYVFILEKDDNNNLSLRSTIVLDKFMPLLDYNFARELHNKIHDDFNRLPKFLFLGENQIERAKDLSRLADERYLQERIHQAEKRHKIQNNIHQELENNGPEIDDDWDLER